MVGFVKIFDHYDHKIIFGHFLSSPVKLLTDLDLTFRLNFNHGYLRCVILQNLDTILMYTEDTRQKIISFPFKMFKMRFLRSSNCTEIA